MEKKGQTSFELIFILSVVLVLAVAILSSFNSIKNPTAAMAIVKANTLKALSSGDSEFIIDKISIDQSMGPVKIKIKTIPQTGITCTDINSQGTKQLIRNNGLLDSFTIILNETSTC